MRREKVLVVDDEEMPAGHEWVKVQHDTGNVVLFVARSALARISKAGLKSREGLSLPV